MAIRPLPFSLSARLFVLAAVTVLPALALLIYDDFSLSRDREIEAQAVAHEQVSLAAAEMRQIVEGVRNLLVTLSRVPAVKGGDAQSCTAVLGDTERKFSDHLTIGATDREGNIICAGPPLAPKGAYVGDRTFYQAAAETLRFAVGGYSRDPFYGGRAIGFAYPYRDQAGRFAGVVFASLSLDWLADHFRHTPWSPGSLLTLADSEGTVLLSLPDTALIGTKLPEAQRPLLSAARIGAANRRDGHGPGRVIAYSPIRPGRNEFFASVELSQKHALAEVKQTIRHGALIILASFLLALAAALVAGRYFIERPVEMLLGAAARLSRGEYDARADLAPSAPEFRRLAEAFNHMAAVIQRREQELKEATQAKNQLLAAAGHDLKQPLQVLSMAIDRLARLQPTSQVPQHVERAEMAIHRLARALDNLLQASRIDAGAVAPQKQIVSMGAILRGIAEDFAPLAAEKKLDFTVVMSGAEVETDPHLLREILENLVANALKYTERGRVLVGCRRRQGNLSLQVIDTGPGIPDEDFDEVFAEFRRLNPESGSGVGLGLAIVKRIALLLGHRIELRSKIGKGSCFAVLVPLAHPLDRLARSAAPESGNPALPASAA